MTTTHTFSVSEVFPDGRVLVFTYVRVGDHITVLMNVYDDASLTVGKCYLHLDLLNRADIPQMRD